MRFENAELLWLLLVIPPALLAFFWWSARKRRRLLAGFIQERLLPELTVGLSPRRERMRAMLLAGATGLVIVALARPQWGFTWEEARQRGLDIVVAIDTSKSMLADDLTPNRLTRAKLAALDLIPLAETDRLGVIAFAGSAFLQCPLTVDDGAFRRSVEMVEVDVIPQFGTAVAEAIHTATEAFSNDENFKVLVLFTDGEDHDPGAVEAAKAAAEKGLRIFTIGVGTPDGEMLRIRNADGKYDFVRDSQGQAVKSRLNETLLREIATVTQGFYLPLQGANTMDVLYERGLAPLPKSESEARLYKHYHERFHWPLAGAILLLMIEVLMPARARERREGAGSPAATAAARTVIALLVCWLGSSASLLASTRSAAREYQAGNFEKALEEYDHLIRRGKDDPRLQFNAGDAAYRQQQYEEAIKRFDQVVNAPDLELQKQAYYNRGNALFQLGRAQSDPQGMKAQWEQALKDYEAALKLDEHDADARFNYEFVKKQLELLKQQQQQQQQQGGGDSENKPKENDQQNQDQSQQDQQQNQSEQQEQQNSQQDQQQNQQQGQQQDQQNQSEQQGSQEDQKEPDSKGDSMTEQKPDQDQKQPRSGQKKEDQQEQAAARQPSPGQMTPEEAARLLESLEGDEKMLPISTGQRRQSNRRLPLKDW